MIPITSVGSYKFRVLEHSVCATNNGFPQLVIQAVVTAVYNEETGEWIDKFEAEGTEYFWVDADMQTTIYLVLNTAEKTLRNYEQAQAAFGWDGKTYSGLNDMNLSKTEFLGVVRENDYNGRITLRVDWIDHADADPTRSLKRLDPAALKNLDAEFSGILKGQTAAVKAPAKAPVKPPAAPKPPTANPTSAPTVGPEDTPTSPVPTVDKTTSPSETSAAPPAPTPKPKTRGKAKPKTTEAQPFGVVGMTKTQAWQKVAELKKDNVLDKHMSNAWVEAVTEVAGDPDIEDPKERFNALDEETFTEVQWRDIAEKTLDRIPHIPF